MTLDIAPPSHYPLGYLEICLPLHDGQLSRSRKAVKEPRIITWWSLHHTNLWVNDFILVCGSLITACVLSTIAYCREYTALLSWTWKDTMKQYVLLKSCVICVIFQADLSSVRLSGVSQSISLFKWRTVFIGIIVCTTQWYQTICKRRNVSVSNVADTIMNFKISLLLEYLE